jgi:photosystem II stability/assembly factor-like uncharacterized protein
LWGTEERVYAVGSSGRLISFTGDDGWRDEQPPTDKTLRAIFGNSPNDLFAVGQQGVIIHFDGNIWSPVRSSTNRDFRDVSIADRMVIAIVGQKTIFSFTY